MMTNATVDYIQEIYQRLVMYKATSGKSYRAIAEEAEISYNVLSKLTGKSRRMSENNLDKLVTYLEDYGA